MAHIQIDIQTMRYRIMCPAPLFGHSRFLPSVSTTQPLKSPTYSSNIKENPVIEAVAEKSHEQSPCPIDPGLIIAILEKRVRLVQVLPAILETPLLILISSYRKRQARVQSLAVLQVHRLKGEPGEGGVASERNSIGSNPRHYELRRKDLCLWLHAVVGDGL